MLRAAAKKIDARVEATEAIDVDGRATNRVSETRIRIRENDVMRAMADALEDILHAERSND